MRICVLSDEEIEDFDPSPFMKDFEWKLVTLKAPVFEKIRDLADSKEFDVFLNVCEGYEPEVLEQNDAGYEGIEVIKALENLGVPFTGADSRCYDPSREEMQAVAEVHGIGFPTGYRVRNVKEAVELAGDLRYPIMVKHPKSYGSTGMFKESRADSLEQVSTQVTRICTEFGAARMEEFIIGREYNVLVVDDAYNLNQPFAYPPAELIFPPGEEFWHTDIKWNYSVPFGLNEVTDGALAARLREAATRMFLAMGVAGYGRCDIRINSKDELFVLEINPNPGIMLPLEEYGPADYMILYDEDGYKGFFDRVIQAAFARQRLRPRICIQDDNPEV
jgi:D-alanine-D-alanine ligase-like ATP-grasp enzyme